MVPLSTLHPHGHRLTPSLAPAQQITSRQRGLLNHIRMAGMACRVAARIDLFEACALLALDGQSAKRTFIETLVKCLSNSLHKRVTWYAPGTVELSFDEAWVMRCLSCIERNDVHSLTFLLRSRVQPSDRRYIGFLMGRISEQFTQI